MKLLNKFLGNLNIGSSKSVNYIANNIEGKDRLNNNFCIKEEPLASEEIKELWKEYPSIYSTLLALGDNEEIVFYEDTVESISKLKARSLSSLDNEEELIRKISNALIEYTQDMNIENLRILYKMVYNTNIILLVDGILDTLIQSYEDINFENLYKTGSWFCRESCHKSPVIFGIALLSRIKIDDEILEVLSKAEIFVLPLAVGITSEGRDVNSKLIALASNTAGYSRIGLIERINPLTYEEKLWFINNSWKFKYRNSQVAKIALEKGEAIKVLEDRIQSREVILNISILLKLLLHREPYREAKTIEDIDRLIELYEKRISTLEKSSKILEALDSIEKFYLWKDKGR